jgi:hypothetical protein
MFELLTPEELAHLEAGARIARELLAVEDAGRGLPETWREWLEAERSRKAAT